MSETIKRKSLFDHLKAVTQEQDVNYFNKISDEDKKSWSNYMLLRFLSMNDSLRPLVVTLQPLVQELEPKLFYKTLIGLIPKGSYYSKYVKGINDTTYEPWLIELISIEYKVSKTIASDYLDILYSNTMGKLTVKHICQKYGTEIKKIQSLKLGKKVMEPKKEKK